MPRFKEPKKTYIKNGKFDVKEYERIYQQKLGRLYVSFTKEQIAVIKERFQTDKITMADFLRSPVDAYMKINEKYSEPSFIKKLESQGISLEEFYYNAMKEFMETE